MCYAVKCKKCGKMTWAGCGAHADQVLRQFPEAERCHCPRESKGGMFDFFGKKG